MEWSCRHGFRFIVVVVGKIIIIVVVIVVVVGGSLYVDFVGDDLWEKQIDQLYDMITKVVILVVVCAIANIIITI